MSHNIKSSTGPMLSRVAVVLAVLIGVSLPVIALSPLIFGTTTVVMESQSNAIESVSMGPGAEDCEYMRCLAVAVPNSVDSGVVYLTLPDGTIVDWQRIPYAGAKMIMNHNGHGEYTVTVRDNGDVLGSVNVVFGTDVPDYVPDIWGVDITEQTKQ